MNMKRFHRPSKAKPVVVLASLAAMMGATTALAGPSGQPFTNYQPSLVVTETMAVQGTFPPIGGIGPATGDTLGFVYDFAGTFAPSGTIPLQGQTLSIQQNIPTFALLGTTYGGNGTTNFAVPNLTGQAAMGTGAGPGLTPRQLGVATGSSTVTLSTAQLPAPKGGGQPFNNVQPSLPLQPLIATAGIFPSTGGNSGSASFLGQVAYFGGGFAPGGWTVANGQLLSIANNTALFALLGTTYGGDGKTTFALPDLRGRIIVGADNAQPLGASFGAESTALTAAQLQGAPVSNAQPSLAMNYLIATSGIFPSQGGGNSLSATTPTLGEIVTFAGGFAPSGWALADGELLNIADDQALFALIGTTYGGDGITTFALPDLRGRTVIGAGNGFNVGDVMGQDPITLGPANFPNAVPEPETYAMLMAGMAILAGARRRRTT
jgi:microcystin-dependent protein